MLFENKVFVNETLTLRNCVFLNDNPVDVCVRFENIEFINNPVEVKEYWHKQTDYYKWAKHKISGR